MTSRETHRDDRSTSRVEDDRDGAGERSPMTEQDRAVAFAATRRLGVLTTLKRDGRPQLSLINYAIDVEGPTVRVSVTDDRAKTRNVRRDPRVSLLVTSDDGWSYAVLEGDAELGPVAREPH